MFLHELLKIDKNIKVKRDNEFWGKGYYIYAKYDYFEDVNEEIYDITPDDIIAKDWVTYAE